MHYLRCHVLHEPSDDLWALNVIISYSRMSSYYRNIELKDSFLPYYMPSFI